MSFPRAISDDMAPTFKALWRSEMTTREVAAHFGVAQGTVHRTAERLGLAARSVARSRDAGRVTEAPRSEDAVSLPCIGSTGFWTPKRDAAVIRTGGRYGNVSKLADRWGVASSRILARWHLLRAG